MSTSRNPHEDLLKSLFLNEPTKEGILRTLDLIVSEVSAFEKASRPSSGASRGAQEKKSEDPRRTRREPFVREAPGAPAPEGSPAASGTEASKTPHLSQEETDKTFLVYLREPDEAGFSRRGTQRNASLEEAVAEALALQEAFPASEIQIREVYSGLRTWSL